jgi:hypothetical protein
MPMMTAVPPLQSRSQMAMPSNDMPGTPLSEPDSPLFRGQNVVQQSKLELVVLEFQSSILKAEGLTFY